MTSTETSTELTDRKTGRDLVDPRVRDRKPGLTDIEAPAGLVLGGLLSLYGLKRRDLFGLFAAGVGAGLLYRGARQNDLFGGGWLRRLLNTGTRHFVSFDRRLIIDRPPQQVYDFFRDFENLAIYLPHIRDVKVIDDRLSAWQLVLTEGLRLDWICEIVEEERGQSLSWRVSEPSDVYHRGTLIFESLRDGRSTGLAVHLDVLAPLGGPGARLLEWLQDLPIRYFSEDIQRLRSVLEDHDLS